MTLWELKRTKTGELIKRYYKLKSMLERFENSNVNIEPIENRFYDVCTELVNRGFNEDNI